MLTINFFVNLTLKPLLLMALAYALFRQDKNRSASHQHLLTTVILWGVPGLIVCSFLLPVLPLRTTLLALSETSFWNQPWQAILLEPWVQAVFGLYLFVVLFQLFYLCLGLALLANIEMQASAFNHGLLLKQLVQLTGVQKNVSVKLSEKIRYPQVWGWKNPTLLLPTSASLQPTAQLQLIFLHELGHVQRNDWLVRQITRVICALFWFLPPVWWLAKQQVEFSERATDDWVLQQHSRPTDYAELLLNNAHALRQDFPTEAINGSPLFQRICLLLDQQQDRDAREPQSLALAFLMIALLSLGIGATQFVPNSAGFIKNPLHFNWRAMETPAQINEAPTQKILAPRHAFTLVARSPSAPQPETIRVIAHAYEPGITEKSVTVSVEIGSPNIARITHIMPVQLVTPVYPRGAIQRGVEGVVKLEFDINTDGRAENIVPLSNTNSLITQAAIDALRASQFARPRLQGQAFTLTHVTEEYRFQLFNEPPDT